MKILVAFLLIVAAVKTSDATTDPWIGGFRRTFGIGSGSMVNIPRNKTEAIAANYIERTPPERSVGPMSQLSMYCLACNYLCIFYDDTTYVAGVQVAFPKNNVSDNVFDFADQGYVTWNVTEDGVTTEHWATQAFFVSTDFLETDADTRIADRLANKTLQDTGVWVPGAGGDLVFISKNATQLADNNSFTKQACFPWMGRHFYYNMSSTTECTAENLLPWFAVVDSGELIEVAFNLIGSLTIGSQCESIFESPGSIAVKLIVPDAPDWYYDYAASPGFTTLHIYLVNEPWYVTCIGQ